MPGQSILEMTQQHMLGRLQNLLGPGRASPGNLPAEEGFPRGEGFSCSLHRWAKGK